MDFKIYSGLSSSLFDSDGNLILAKEKRVEGAWYVTIDTVDIYIYLNGVMNPVAANSWDETRISALEDTVEQLSEKVLNENAVTYERYGYYDTLIKNVPGDPTVIYMVTDKNCDYIWNNETQEYELYREYNQTGGEFVVEKIFGGDADSTEW